MAFSRHLFLMMALFFAVSLSTPSHTFFRLLNTNARHFKRNFGSDKKKISFTDRIVSEDTSAVQLGKKIGTESIYIRLKAFNTLQKFIRERFGNESLETSLTIEGLPRVSNPRTDVEYLATYRDWPSMLHGTLKTIDIFVEHLFDTWQFEATHNNTEQNLAHDFMYILLHTCRLHHLVDELVTVCGYGQHVSGNLNSTFGEKGETMATDGLSGQDYLVRVDERFNTTAGAKARGRRKSATTTSGAICAQVFVDDFDVGKVVRGSFDIPKSKALQLVETFVILREYRLYLGKLLMYFHIFEEYFKGCDDIF